jgi:hypothetical protein
MHPSGFLDQVEIYPLPRTAAPLMQPSAIVLIPAGFWLVKSVDHWQLTLALYQRAFQEAQAIAKPSLVERDLMGVWN